MLTLAASYQHRPGRVSLLKMDTLRNFDPKRINNRCIKFEVFTRGEDACCGISICDTVYSARMVMIFGEIYRVFQGESATLRENFPSVKLE